MGGAGIERSGGGGKRRSHARRKPMAEINVTPFVDVMLVLLIIFMVAAPLLTVGVPVDLPQTEASALPTDVDEPIAITVAVDGALFLQEDPVTLENLVPNLNALGLEAADERLLLRADGAVPYGVVLEVMGRLNAGGYTEIGLVGEALTQTAREN